jgi:DNA-binding NarL/FixJ family response regulator
MHIVVSQNVPVLPLDPTAPVASVLSPRELDVLDLLVQGWRTRNIARKLCISVRAVLTLRACINRKLACTAPSELLQFAGANGLLRPTRSAGG